MGRHVEKMYMKITLWSTRARKTVNIVQRYIEHYGIRTTQIINRDLEDMLHPVDPSTRWARPASLFVVIHLEPHAIDA